MWEVQLYAADGYVPSQGPCGVPGGPFLLRGVWTMVERYATFVEAEEAANCWWRGVWMWQCRVRFVRA